MATTSPTLAAVFEGWADSNQSILNAVAPLTPEQLAFRPRPGLRSAGDIAAHIAEGRVTWFSRMGAPGSAALMAEVERLDDLKGLATDAAQLVHWLNASWGMVADTLAAWTVADLAVSYRHAYIGKVFAVSRQWTIWRIVAHDLHHGGELSVTLGLQGIDVPELGDLGGHTTFPPLAD